MEANPRPPSGGFEPPSHLGGRRGGPPPPSGFEAAPNVGPPPYPPPPPSGFHPGSGAFEPPSHIGSGAQLPASGAYEPPPSRVGSSGHLPPVQGPSRFRPPSGQRQASIGPYAVSERLGHGGFGVVYKVEHPARPGVPYALKLLLSTHPTDVSRFLREAELARRFDDPGLARVLDVGQYEASAYYVMEYCPGQTLAERLHRGGPLGLREAAELIRDIARTLETVHAKGVVHRDLKPGNIIIDPGTGRPRVTDFGLARDRMGASLTRTGDGLGTPFYMAPELFHDAKRADRRADVWALGVILYECLTGRRPFGGTGVGEIASNVWSARIVPPSLSRPEVPPELDAICLRALARKPHQRTRSALALAEELEDFLSGKTAAAHRRGQAIKLAMVVAPILLVAIGIAVYALTRPAPRRATASASPAAPRPTPPLPEPERTPEPEPEPEPQVVPPPDPTPPAEADPFERAAQAQAALQKARDADRAIEPLPRVLELLAQARELAREAPDVLDRVELAALEALAGRGRDRELIERASALSGLSEGADRKARLLRALAHRRLREGDAFAGLIRELAAEPAEPDGVGQLAASYARSLSGAQHELALIERAVELDPDLAHAHALLATARHQQRQSAEGLAVIDAARARTPNDNDLLWTQVQILQETRRSAEAMEPLDRLIALGGESPSYDALYQRARMDLHLGRHQDAIATLGRALQARPNELTALLMRGVCRHTLRDGPGAAADWRLAATLHGQDAFAQQLEGRYRDPEFQRVVWATVLAAVAPAPIPQTPAALEPVARPVPDAIRPQVTQLLAAAGRGEPWTRLADGWRAAAEAEPRSARIALMRAAALLGRGHPEKARAELERAAGLGPSEAEENARRRLAADAAWDLGDIDGAIALWRELATGSDADAQRADALLAWHANRNAPGALGALERAVQQQQHVPSVITLVALHATAGDPLRGIGAADWALQQIGAGDVGLLIARARCVARLFAQRGGGEEAVRHALAPLAQVGADAPLVLSQAALVGSQAGPSATQTLAWAGEQSARAIELAPDDARVARIAGVVALRRGRPLAEVLAPWKRCRELDPALGVPAGWLDEAARAHPEAREQLEALLGTRGR